MIALLLAILALFTANPTCAGTNDPTTTSTTIELTVPHAPTGTGGNHPEPGPGDRITEDDPRWDCATMGNRICGPGRPSDIGPTLTGPNDPTNPNPED